MHSPISAPLSRGERPVREIDHDLYSAAERRRFGSDGFYDFKVFQSKNVRESEPRFARMFVQILQYLLAQTLSSPYGLEWVRFMRSGCQ